MIVCQAYSQDFNCGGNYVGCPNVKHWDNEVDKLLRLYISDNTCHYSNRGDIILHPPQDQDIPQIHSGPGETKQCNACVHSQRWSWSSGAEQLNIEELFASRTECWCRCKGGPRRLSRLVPGSPLTTAVDTDYHKSVRSTYYTTDLGRFTLRWLYLFIVALEWITHFTK